MNDWFKAIGNCARHLQLRIQSLRPIKLTRADSLKLQYRHGEENNEDSVALGQIADKHNRGTFNFIAPDEYG